MPSGTTPAYGNTLFSGHGKTTHIGQLVCGATDIMTNSDSSVGNAWAAAGMLRVHQTLNHSSQTNYFAAHQRNLTQWIDEILEASWSHQVCFVSASSISQLIELPIDTGGWLAERDR
jgi:hypothetical protein